MLMRELVNEFELGQKLLSKTCRHINIKQNVTCISASFKNQSQNTQDTKLNLTLSTLNYVTVSADSHTRDNDLKPESEL